MSSDPIDMSKKRFIVSIYEVQQKVVFAEEFTGRYTRSVTMADGTTRTVELTPMMRHGQPVVEFNDTGGRTYIGTVRVGTGTTINGKLMVQIADVDDVEAARAEWRTHFQTGPVLPHNTSLISIPEFVPPDFAQGIEMFNDSTTPMQFVTDVLTTHAGLNPEESRKTMLAIHTRGGALIPTPSFDEAKRIAAQITAEAAKRGHPLLCRPVSINPSLA
jgi:ATP-dependent Clp protease adapter protein ClpS